MRITLFPFICLLLASLYASDSEMPATHATIIAAPGLGADGQINPGWMRTHESFLARAKAGAIDLLFLGDSITQGWNSVPELWQQEFGRWSPANFGIGGDRTENLLWRIEHGELDGITPRVVVVLIGTNNIGDEFEAVAQGVTAVVAAVRAKLPAAKVLLLGLFPRGVSFWDGGRRITRNANTLLAKLHDGKQVHFLDLTDRFVQPDHTLLKSQFPDNLHPSAEGYKVWAESMRPTLQRLMAEPSAP